LSVLRPSTALHKMPKKQVENEKPKSSANEAKERKKFELPGQTKELNMDAVDSQALKTFYESLYKQIPDSEMAKKFLLQHGLLEKGDAEKVYKQLNNGKKQPAKSSSPAAKRKANDDDDFAKKPKKAAPAKKPPAMKPPPQKKVVDSSDEEEEFISKKKPAAKAAPKPAAKADPKPAAKPAAKPAVKADPDSSDDEDDRPLSQRVKK